MRTHIVLTLTGPDRIGIVEEVTRVLGVLGANVGTSRMVRLGGEFAILLQASLPTEQIGTVDSAFAHLAREGYKVSSSVTVEQPARASWPAYHIVVSGADHEGIVHEIASGLAGRGISIESMDTETVAAPTTGTPLFTMTARVVVPPALTEEEWTVALDEAARVAGVDIEVALAD